MSNFHLWTIWAIGTVGIGAWLVFALPTADSARTSSTFFLPGETTHGHYQIEIKCGMCHEPGGAVREESCMECHASDLKLARDTHPKSKFRDPQKIPLLQKIDATRCVTCHREHAPDQTLAHGLTVPSDYCVNCHQDVAEDRPSHRDFAFDSCSTVGCHNYHDNTALYENFLVRHAAQPSLLDDPRIPLRGSQTEIRNAKVERQALTRSEIDAPTKFAADKSIIHAWESTAHAKAGVNCTACHTAPVEDVSELEKATTTANRGAWTSTVDINTCQKCHQDETSGFMAGLHGMRIQAGLTSMSPSFARLPMNHDSLHRSLDCSSCHSGHEFDTKLAAVEACLKCHDDNHSREYAGSKHYQLWLGEILGEAPAGSGVSCATCHMPRIEGESAGLSRDSIRVVHNQSWNLAPVEKMVRSVCMNCHGLDFSLNALADPSLKDTCYEGSPKGQLKTIHMAESWFKSRQTKRSVAE
tara:strand:- start:174086 stop:175495 length:1410 start_codon:yes stop_codon:yes gene_type:complete